jgi:hypothetical protein
VPLQLLAYHLGMPAKFSALPVDGCSWETQLYSAATSIEIRNLSVSCETEVVGSVPVPPFDAARRSFEG